MIERTIYLVFAIWALSACVTTPASEPQASGRMESADLFRVGENAYKAGLYSDAKKQFETLLETNPEHLDARFRLGNIAMLEGDRTSAREQYEHLLRVEPRYAKGHYNLALIYLQQAEDHFSFYTATAPDEDMNGRLIELLAAIDDFSGSRSGEKAERAASPLDSLGSLLKEDSQ